MSEQDRVTMEDLRQRAHERRQEWLEHMARRLEAKDAEIARLEAQVDRLFSMNGTLWNIIGALREERAIKNPSPQDDPREG